MVLVAAANGVPSSAAEEPMDCSNFRRAMDHVISTNDMLWAASNEYEDGLNESTPNEQEDGNTDAP